MKVFTIYLAKTFAISLASTAGMFAALLVISEIEQKREERKHKPHLTVVK